MKKKLMAVVLCVTIVGAMLVGCGSSSDSSSSDAATAPAAEDVTFDVEPEYEPNADYDKYTVFEYTIESAGATFPVTLSANNAEDSFEIHCNFYGDEQLVTVEKSGDEFTVTFDKTSFMTGDAPAICQAGIDAANWAAIQ
jgi:ABC-type glycerol-3-phosphate transport system substrate-binding protein